MKYSSCCCWNM